MSFELPEQFNIADYFLDARVREGKGNKTALVCGRRKLSYREVQALANRFGNVLAGLGVRPEERVIIALPDIPEWVGAFFGILKIGAVVVMVNPQLKPDEIAYFYDYTGASLAIVHVETHGAFAEAARGAKRLRNLLVVGKAPEGTLSFSAEALRASDRLETYPSHRDDAAIWLFSGGTTGRPKAVVQTHTSFANTADCYAKGIVDYREEDIVISVPKLYFGYATGWNLLFSFWAGGTSVIFPERCTADVLFEQIKAHRPTILVNVPTMVNQMVSHPKASEQDLSCLRLSTSASEALPVELYQRWKKAFGVELLDGLGTAEMWGIFITNRLGDVRPGTLGRVVEGFEIKVCDESGNEVPPGETGTLWVRGNSLAIGYWRQREKTRSAFRGEWYVTGDLVSRDEAGYVTFSGRGDELLKVGGKWLSPAEVENCLLQHPAVKECAVVGVKDAAGLVKPHAYVVAREKPQGLGEVLKGFVREKLQPYKYPREVVFLDVLPRTHLGKVDRARLRRGEIL